MKRVMSFLLAGAISILAVEVALRALRMYGVNTIDSVSNPVAFIDDEENIGINEGYGIRTGNSVGALDRELKEDSVGLTRILLFGDSFTEAFQVHDNEVYDNIAENQFARQGKNVEIVNFGRSGHSSVDELDFYIHYAKQIKHDFVLIQFSPNDYSENLQSEYKIDSIGYKISPNRWIKYTNGRKSRIIYFLRRNSVLFNLLVIRSYEFLDIMKGIDEKERVSSSIVPDEPQIDKTRFVFKMMKDYATKLGVKRVFLFQVPDLTNEENNNEDVIRRICDDTGVEYLDIMNDLNEARSSKKNHVNGFLNSKLGVGHLNEFGHRLVGGYLFNRLNGGSYDIQ